MKDNIVYNKSFDFAIKIVNLYKDLCLNEREFVLSKQLLRSGTSIGANVSEAIKAQSKKDFISKLHIAFKEAGETKYWLDLLVATNYLDSLSNDELLNQLTEITKLLNSIMVSKNIHGDTSLDTAIS